MKKMLVTLAALAALGGTGLSIAGDSAPNGGAATCTPCDPSECGPCDPKECVPCPGCPLAG